ncbi:MAG: glycosyltransferase family 4 protein [Synechococcus sp.]
MFRNSYIGVEKASILVVTRTFLPQEGGIEEYVYDRCTRDSKRVVVLAADCPGARSFDRSQPFTIYRWPNPEFLKKSLIGKVTRQLFCMVFSVIMGLFLYWKYRFKYIEWCHGYDFPSILVLGYLLPIRYFVYLHGNDLLCPLRNRLFKSVFRWTLNRSSGVVCNSWFTRSYLLNSVSITSQAYVINPTVRPSKFGLSSMYSSSAEGSGAAVRQKFGIPTDSVVILTVGRLIKRKGFDRVISQIPSLLSKGLDVHYLICGRGKMEQDLRALANSLNVEDRVHFVGFVPDSELASYYDACDLFAMLTFFDADSQSIEGFGIVYREAGFFGKPVLASKVGGVIDAVQHLKNGLLVDPDSSTELQLALSQLCRDEVLRERLGQTGQELAEQRPSFQVLYQQDS